MLFNVDTYGREWKGEYGGPIEFGNKSLKLIPRIWLVESYFAINLVIWVSRILRLELSGALRKWATRILYCSQNASLLFSLSW